MVYGMMRDHHRQITAWINQNTAQLTHTLITQKYRLTPIIFHRRPDDNHQLHQQNRTPDPEHWHRNSEEDFHPWTQHCFCAALYLARVFTTEMVWGWHRMSMKNFFRLVCLQWSNQKENDVLQETQQPISDLENLGIIRLGSITLSPLAPLKESNPNSPWK